MAVRDIDLMDPTVFSDGIPYDYFRRLRHSDRLPLARDTDGQPFWYLTRHEDVARVSRDHETFASGPTTMTSVRKADITDPVITFLDGPAHTRMRKLAFKAFAPARMALLKKPIRGIVDSLLAEVVEKGEFDLAEDVALRLPFQVLAELLGVPEPDRDVVIDWARHTVNLGDPEYDLAAGEEDVFDRLLGYFRDLAEARSRQPADDLFSILLAARLKSDRINLPDRLSTEEIAVFATTLITAGSETTYCSVSGAVLALLEFGDELAKLRADRSLMPTAVDEVLRWVTPVTHFARNVVRDTEIGGQPIGAGERVVMWYTSANRDEEVFADPDRFDVTRSPNPHVTFGGGGPHFCIGNGLAVLELTQFLDAAIDLLPRMEITGTPVRPESNFMNCVKHLPMRYR
ncbi:cytochrome P450 [Actinoallomurus liliacearum]|uniref:Cytochrome P450 n=1 Tax=Actinoallomurus liliacearum TaxID=1080073 RepID=A0ABP8TRY9_9ACTN